MLSVLHGVLGLSTFKERSIKHSPKGKYVGHYSPLVGWSQRRFASFLVWTYVEEMFGSAANLYNPSTGDNDAGGWL